MPTSGQHFSLNYFNSDYKKSMDISNYYLDEFALIVKNLNKLVPKEFEINYTKEKKYSYTTW